MKTYYVLLLVAWSSSAFAQNMSQSVTAAAGNFSRNLEEGSSISWTLGEISTEFMDQQYSIQQGFQQAELLVLVRTNQPLVPASDWQFFPNPADFQLQLQTQFIGTWYYDIHDVLGRKMLQGQAEQKDIQLELPPLDAGIYLIRVWNATGSSHSQPLLIQQN